MSWRWQGRRALSCCHAWSPLQSSRSSALQVHSGLGSVPPEGRLLRPASGLGTAHYHHTRSPVLGAQLLTSQGAWQTWPARRSRPQASCTCGKRFLASLGVQPEAAQRPQRGLQWPVRQVLRTHWAHAPRQPSLASPRDPGTQNVNITALPPKGRPASGADRKGQQERERREPETGAGTWRSGQPVATPVEGGKVD